jgi:predicted  nucleic acid-binding Zn-ribbon protein
MSSEGEKFADIAAVRKYFRDRLVKTERRLSESDEKVRKLEGELVEARERIQKLEITERRAVALGKKVKRLESER